MSSPSRAMTLNGLMVAKRCSIAKAAILSPAQSLQGLGGRAEPVRSVCIPESGGLLRGDQLRGIAKSARRSPIGPHKRAYRRLGILLDVGFQSGCGDPRQRVPGGVEVGEVKGRGHFLAVRLEPSGSQLGEKLGRISERTGTDTLYWRCRREAACGLLEFYDVRFCWSGPDCRNEPPTTAQHSR